MVGVLRAKLSQVVLAITIAALLLAPGAFGAGRTTEASRLPTEIEAWTLTAKDPSALRAALNDHSQKTPVEFAERLKYAQADGSLRLMVALRERDASTEAFVLSATQAVVWYGEGPRFYALATPDDVTKLLRDHRVRFVEPDFPITRLMAESTVEIRARTLGSMEGVWEFDASGGPMGSLTSSVPGTSRPITGRDVTVAVIDSGIDQTHKDFGGWDCAAGPFAPCDSRIRAAVKVDPLFGFGEDPFAAGPTTEFASGHGTHVAGTIGGNGYYVRDGDADARYGGDGLVIGVAPETRLVSVSNGDSDSAGLSDFALQWALDHADELGIRVASNSWGCFGGCAWSSVSATAQILEELYDAGVLVTFAVGNDGGEGSGDEFSGYAQSPHVLGVANFDDSTDLLSSSSSRGSASTTLADPETWTPDSEGADPARRPDVAAPGTDIWSAASLTGGTATVSPRVATNDVTGGPNACCTVPYRVLSGTSMATPHVAGAAALLFDACDGATPLDVMRAVMAGADATHVAKTTGTAFAEPFEVGYGSLDVRGSLDWLLANVDCAGSPRPEVSILTPLEGEAVAPGSLGVSGTVDRMGSPYPVAPSAGPRSTLYFHRGLVPVGVVDVAVGGTTMDENAPTASDPAVHHGLWVLDGGNPRTVFEANWASLAPVAIDAESVRVVWYASTAGDSILFANWDVALYEKSGSVWTQLGSTTVERQALLPSGVVEFSAVVPSVTTAGTGVLAVTIDPVFGVPDGVHAIYFDAVGLASRLEIGTTSVFMEPERVDVSLDGGPVVGVPIDSSSGVAAWGAAFDLSGASEGPHSVEAAWFDFGGALVGTDSVAFVVSSPNEPPTATISAAATATTGESVSFDGTGSADPDGTLVDYAWEFGDGTTGTGALVTHVYSEAGTYVVTLSVTDDDGATASATQSLEVAAPEPSDPEPGAGQKLVTVASWTGRPCGSEWRLSLTRFQDAATEAPATLRIHWIGGSYEDVAAQTVGKKSATYSTTTSGVDFDYASAIVPEAWNGRFTVQQGVC